jgi:hypothetical protein
MQFDLRDYTLLESWSVDSNFVGAGAQGWKGVCAVAARLGLDNAVCTKIGNGDCRADNDGTVRVGDLTGDTAGVALGKERRTGAEHQQGEQGKMVENASLHRILPEC